MREKHTSEKGQVLVLLVLGFVVLLGFTAFAIDGGMVYSDRRHAQNAADASSLAGGAAAALYLENALVSYEDWKCSDTDVKKAMNDASNGAEAKAIARAADNGYAIGTNNTTGNYVEATCGSDDYVGWTDKYIDVKTVITRDTQTAFAHFVYSGPLRNTVEAVTRVRPPSPLVFGNAVVALREDCPNSNTGGVHFDGNSPVQVNGSGVFSNACLVAVGTVDVNVNGGGIHCIGDDCYKESGGPDVDPTPKPVTKRVPSFAYVIPVPDCSESADRGSHEGGGEIKPGIYSRIRVNSANDDLVLKSGLYCLDGNFTVNGGSVTVEEGGGVTIYMRSGDFYVGGSVYVNLVAPPTPLVANCGYCPPAIPGVLIYMAQDNDGEIALMGDADSNYVGTIFAPAGMIEAGGGSMEQLSAQLIADTIFIHGNTQMVVNYDDERNYRPPSLMELYK